MGASRVREPGLAGVDFEVLHAVQQRVLLHLSLGQRHLGPRQLHFQTFVFLRQHLETKKEWGTSLRKINVKKTEVAGRNHAG